MKQNKIIVTILSIFVLITFGGSYSAYGISKKLKKANAKIDHLSKVNTDIKSLYANCKDTAELLREEIIRLKSEKTMLSTQLSDQRAANDQVLGHLKDLSVITGKQAESINKFLETMGAKDAYIKDLHSAIERKDSMTMALVMNLKNAIGNLDDNDINIKIDKGVVYIDISDKMLFKSGKYEVTDRAREVLGKVAKVLLAHPEIEFMVEGHTDNVPFREGPLQDNWDLSVKRATSVIRILQNDYNILPAKMTAAGRSEYVPIADNTTTDGRATNRRTRIVILPQLDQFFQLLEKNK